MPTTAWNRNKNKTRNFFMGAGVVLLAGLMLLVSCSSSSDTRNTAKQATSGPYEILVRITAPTNGSVITFGTDATTNAEFEVVATGGSGTYGYTWTIAGPTTTSTSSSTSGTGTLSFFEEGPHTLTATVTDSNGIVGSDSIGVTVSSQPTTNITIGAIITVPAANVTINRGDSITFTGVGSSGSGTYTYLWDIPGGDTRNVFTQTTGAITFNDTGTYTVRLTVTDTLGDVGTDTVTVTVTDAPLTTFRVNITTLASLFTYNVGESVTFTQTTTGGSGTYNYLWDLSPSTNVTGYTTAARTGTGATDSLSLTFNTAGTYTIHITVNDTVLSNTTTDAIIITIK